MYLVLYQVLVLVREDHDVEAKLLPPLDHKHRDDRWRERNGGERMIGVDVIGLL